MEGVSRFLFIGSIANDQAKMDSGVQHIIRAADKTFYKLREKEFKHRALTSATEIAVYRVPFVANLLYPAEACGKISKRQESMLGVAQMRNLRHVAGIYRFHQKEQKLKNEDIRRQLKVEPVAEILRQRQLRWASHVARKDDGSIVKKITFGWVKGGRLKLRSGGNSQTFHNAIHDALRDRDIPELDWYRIAQNRGEWRVRVVNGTREDEAEGAAMMAGKKKQPGRAEAYMVQQARPKNPSKAPKGGRKWLPSGEGTYDCPACDAKGFKTPLAIGKHYGKEHGEQARSKEASQDGFQCTICQKGFGGEWELKKYMTEQHSGD